MQNGNASPPRKYCFRYDFNADQDDTNEGANGKNLPTSNDVHPYKALRYMGTQLIDDGTTEVFVYEVGLDEVQLQGSPGGQHFDRDPSSIEANSESRSPRVLRLYVSTEDGAIVREEVGSGAISGSSRSTNVIVVDSMERANDSIGLTSSTAKHSLFHAPVYECRRGFDDLESLVI